jgi:hypothetical protein
VSAPDPSRKLAALVRRLRGSHAEPVYAAPHTPEGHDPLVVEFVQSFLAWEAGTARAEAALKRLLHAVVDYNELRVCLPDELARILGERYPRALDRAARLRAALNDLYRREHAVTFQPLTGMPKRDARLYLDALDGVPPFVAARMTLLTLGGHAFPADDRILVALKEEQAAPPDLPIDGAESWLERQFRSGEAVGAYLLIEGWLNERTARRAGAERTPARRTSTRQGTRPRHQS